MELVQNLWDFFKQPPEDTRKKTPEGLCPVCWGYQEYDHKVRTLYKDKQVDVNNHRDSYMLIQDFVTKNIDGIRLKRGEIDSCPTCSKT